MVSELGYIALLCEWIWRIYIILIIQQMSKPEDENTPCQIKLIAVGDSGVGKTSILTRFTYEKFNDYSEPTLGAAFLTKKHTLPSKKTIEFHVLVL